MANYQQHPHSYQYANGSRSPAPTMSSQPSSGSMSNSSSTPKPADYVYFDRTAAGFSAEAVPRAKAAQLKLEHFYKVAVDSAIERNQRCVLAACVPLHLLMNAPALPGESSSSDACRQTTR